MSLEEQIARRAHELLLQRSGEHGHDLADRLHKPLGNPAQNGIKFFAVSELLELVEDRAWLVKMTSVVNQHWQQTVMLDGNLRPIYCAL